MLSAIEYPHWLMLAGAFLVLSGLIGLAFRKKSEDEGVQSPAPSPIQRCRRTGDKGEEEMSKRPLVASPPRTSAEVERLRALGGAMDLVTGAKRVVSHAACGQGKAQDRESATDISQNHRSSREPTWAGRRATLMETAPGELADVSISNCLGFMPVPALRLGMPGRAAHRISGRQKTVTGCGAER